MHLASPDGKITFGHGKSSPCLAPPVEERIRKVNLLTSAGTPDLNTTGPLIKYAKRYQDINRKRNKTAQLLIKNPFMEIWSTMRKLRRENIPSDDEDGFYSGKRHCK